ncbi:hypothetical protein DWX11_12975 [Ruminococcus sp. AF18-29]|uniref:hypothetical protein n=1 Tax=Ruminococcus bicirculans (ex Wegman et al. 2014) TaxID=1160721 RepID=UPI000E4B12A3|nr:hypothetical protein DWX11_12975 [Ruminococcus sp. AF18-29]
MITKEEFEKAVEYCASDTTDCDGCPLCASDKQRVCSTYLAEYLKENEPAPAATGTSSEVSDDTCSILQFDDSTKEQICQAYETADEACSNILAVYEGMSECEQRAFDIGEAYGKICSTRDKLEKLRGGDGK